MTLQKNKEAKLKKEMILKYGRYCMNCGRYVPPNHPYLNLDKHEIEPRSLGGDTLDENNCVLLCRGPGIPLTCHHIQDMPWLRRTKREEFPYFKEVE